ncbi:UNVERIFIED_CONTAM: hypothetical protein FKN15_018936 [Acipenser sinensis]
MASDRNAGVMTETDSLRYAEYATKTTSRSDTDVDKRLGFSVYYKGGFETKMSKREASLILGVRSGMSSELIYKNIVNQSTRNKATLNWSTAALSRAPAKDMTKKQSNRGEQDQPRPPSPPNLPSPTEPQRMPALSRDLTQRGEEGSDSYSQVRSPFSEAMEGVYQRSQKGPAPCAPTGVRAPLCGPAGRWRKERNGPAPD